MPHQNTVFHQLLQYIPWQRFDALAKEHGHAQTARTFKPRHHLVSLLNGALSGVQGLRATVTTVSLDAARLYHAGGAGVKRTTLADANRYRDAAAFSGLLEEMIALAHRKLRRDLREALYLIDATSIKLNSLSADWARAQRQSFGAKAHVVYEAEAGIPVYSLVTAATVNDIKVAKKLTIEPKATYAFDLGYHDFQWFADLHDAECRFVTRFKKNTAFTLTETRALPKGAVALADRIGRLSTRMARSRKNPFDHPIRQIEVQTDTGKTLLLMTNDLTSPADEIAAIYKRRWEIEGRPLSRTNGVRGLHLQMDQARPQHHPLHRHIRERGSHASGRQYDRLPAAAPCPEHADRYQATSRIPPRRPRYIDAKTTPQRPQPTTANTQRPKAG